MAGNWGAARWATLGAGVQPVHSDYSSTGARTPGCLWTDSLAVMVRCCFGDINATLSVVPANLSSGGENQGTWAGHPSVRLCPQTGNHYGMPLSTLQGHLLWMIGMATGPKGKKQFQLLVYMLPEPMRLASFSSSVNVLVAFLTRHGLLALDEVQALAGTPLLPRAQSNPPGRPWAPAAPASHTLLSN